MTSPAPLSLHVGCGTVLYPGWVNIDPREIRPVDQSIDVRQGDCLRLPFEAGTVDRIFSNAMFEHVFLALQGEVLREWRRVLADDGVIVTLGIPDFAAICRLYLDGADGITGPDFDLFESYRYVQGFADGHLWEEGYVWDEWDVTGSPDMAPAGYLPQMHKAIFDSDFLVALLGQCGLKGQVFRYAYTGEPHALNLGFVAGRRPGRLDDLNDLAFIDEYVEPGTVERVTSCGPSRMAGIVTLLERGR